MNEHGECWFMVPGINWLALKSKCSAVMISMHPAVDFKNSIYHCNHDSNTLRPRRNGTHFADDIFKHIFFNENISISIQISLKFVPRGPINNIPVDFKNSIYHCNHDSNTLRPRRNGKHFADDIFKHIFFNENI